jgi:hypothetical protein
MGLGINYTFQDRQRGQPGMQIVMSQINRRWVMVYNW